MSAGSNGYPIYNHVVELPGKRLQGFSLGLVEVNGNHGFAPFTWSKRPDKTLLEALHKCGQHAFQRKLLPGGESDVPVEKLLEWSAIGENTGINPAAVAQYLRRRNSH